MSYLKNKVHLTLDGAKKLASFAAEKARELQVGGAIAVTDHGGNLIYLERLEGTMSAASNIAIGKAATAAVFKRPTIKLENLIHETRPVMAGLQGITQTPYVPLMGGQPILYKGEIIGAVSVAGAETGENDEIIALYAKETFENEMI
jgi:glc operon protein GlcG